MTEKKRFKKVAVVNDISGYGHCSTTVIMPIVSHLRMQACPVPTAILSNHTGFNSFYCDDYTDRMHDYISEWKKLGLEFDGIITGFLGSEKQISIVNDFVRCFSKENTRVLIDPVMGDNGKIYATYTKTMCDSMKDMLKFADLITPNLTETCFLTDTPYKTDWSVEEIEQQARRLQQMGARQIVITGIHFNDGEISNFILDAEGNTCVVSTPTVACDRSGTGDVFAAVLVADMVNNVNLIESVKKASGFVSECIEATIQYDLPINTGLCFEDVLYKLK